MILTADDLNSLPKGFILSDYKTNTFDFGTLVDIEYGAPIDSKLIAESSPTCVRVYKKGDKSKLVDWHPLCKKFARITFILACDVEGSEDKRHVGITFSMTMISARDLGQMIRVLSGQKPEMTKGKGLDFSKAIGAIVRFYAEARKFDRTGKPVAGSYANWTLYDSEALWEADKAAYEQTATTGYNMDDDDDSDDSDDSDEDVDMDDDSDEDDSDEDDA